MRLSVRQVPTAVPGRGPVTPKEVREWVCPECDYFEDADALAE
jgi:hypothetical protein